MTRRLRILLITRHFPPEPSNTASLLGELVEDLAGAHEVEVVAVRMQDAGETPPESPNVRLLTVAGVDSRQTVARTARIADYVSFAWLALRAAWTARRPDVVVTINDPPTSGLVASIVAARHRRPLVLICHDLYPDITVALGRRAEGVATQAWRLANRVVHGRATSIVVVGRDMLARMAAQGVPRQKLTFVPAWASRQDTAAETVRRLRRENHWESRFVVMHAGSISSATDLRLCLEVADLLKDIPAVRFVFLGGGPAKATLVDAVAQRSLPNVEFRAPLPKPQAQALMAAADLHLIALIPGLWGCGAPSKAYGIMAASRPFVAAVDEGSEPARIVEEIGCGFAVPAGSTAAVAAAIRAARSAPLEDMAQRGQAEFLARYERSVATGELRETFERAAAARRFRSLR